MGVNAGRVEAMRKRWQDPAFRQAMVERARLRMIERMADPAIAEALFRANRKRMKKRYRDPAERAATALQLKKARNTLKIKRMMKKAKKRGKA